MKKAVKYLKRVLLALAILLAMAMILLGLAWDRIHTRPTFYQPYTWTEKQRETVNQQVVDKLVLIHNLAENAAAQARKAQLHKPVDPNALQPLSLSFTEQELNAFIQHNAEMQGLRRQFENQIAEPAIFFWDGQVILSAEVKKYGFIASAWLKPSLDTNGKLHVDLVRTMAGRLVIPNLIVQSQLDHVRSMITPELPACQREAKMDPTGRANPSAVLTSLLKSALNIVDQQPTDAAIFIPLGDDGKAVPLKLTQLAVEGETLKLTVRPMSEGERGELMSELQKPGAVLKPRRGESQ
jgi:hypothetical protein